MQASGAFNPFKQSAPEAFAEIIKSKGLQKIISLKGSCPIVNSVPVSRVNSRGRIMKQVFAKR